MSTAAPPRFAFDQAMLDRFRERAPAYDRENRFFTEDFEELRATEYLTLAVPLELGGHGLNLAQVGRLQRELATYAPADAVALNMHLYWTGLAADLHATGDRSLQWLLEEAARGAVFASGHAERGNDLGGIYSTSSATPMDGGYRVRGHKSFGTMTPVWDWLGLHAVDRSGDAPRIVHGFAGRDSAGIRIEESWDALGMRATRSDDTVLDDVFIPNDRIATVVPAGAAGLGLFLLGLFAWGLSGFANVYFGIAKRVLELAIAGAKGKTSIAIESGAMAHHPQVQHGIAEMAILCNAMEAHIEQVTDAWSAAVPGAAGWSHEVMGDYGLKLVGLKYLVVEQAFQVVDLGVELAGGFGVSRGGELERLFRDARMGRIHPANAMMSHEFIGKATLGLNFDAKPRWG